jgi:uncharacterized protein
MRKEPLLDLNEAVQHPGKRLVFNFETELETEEDLDLVTPITGHLEAISTGSALVIESSYTTQCVLECSRCGFPLEVPVDFDMEDTFEVEGIPSSYASNSFAKVTSDEPYPLFKDNALIRDTYVRQGLWVNLPTQPLCPHGWDEPCPNDNAPRAEEPDAHPAFEALKSLKPEEED